MAREEYTGIVKWFDANKGYGFIGADTVGNEHPNHFVHVRVIQAAGRDFLNPGDRVAYRLEPGKTGRLAAVDLKFLD